MNRSFYYDFENAPICPYCKNEMEHEYFYVDFQKCKDEDDELIREIKCSNSSCKKTFECSMDKYNQNLGYKSYPLKCKDIKEKHNFEKTYIADFSYDTGKIKNQVFECSKCGEKEYLPIDENGKRISKIKAAQKRKELSFESIKINQKEKTGTYSLIKSDFSKSACLYINTPKREGNSQIGDTLLKTIKKIGFSQNRLNLDKEYDYVDTNPSGEFKNFNFKLSVWPACVEVKIEKKTKEDLTYLENKFFDLVLKKMEKSLTKDFPLIKKQIKEETCHWGRPNLDSVNSFEEKVKLLKKYVAVEEKSNYNTHDKNKKQIRNGDIKFFYNYDGTLSKGEVHHHINNMWWVISGKTIYNIACFDLFDFDSNLKIKKPIDIKKRLEKELNKQIELKNFKRCDKIYQQILKLT